MSESGSPAPPSPLAFALRRLLQHRRPLGWALFWSVLFVLVPLQVPVITGALVDSLRSKHVRLYGMEFSAGTRGRALEIVALVLVGLAVARGLSAYLRMLSVNKLTRQFVREIRCSLIARLTTMPLERHHHV